MTMKNYPLAGRRMPDQVLPERRATLSGSTVVLCEVCGRPAVDRSPPGYGGVKINCPTCGNYSIAGSIRDKFRQLSLDERRRALERAKDHASLGMRPLIGATEL